MKVLLAEDVGIIRRLLEETLRDMGHDVTSVADGEAAWATYERERPPLVVVDWLMPGLDGLELCRRIRVETGGDEVFIVLQTGRGTSDDLAVALAAGVDDYLTKPVTPEHLRARVAIAVQRIGQNEARRHAEAALARAQWLAGIGETALAMQHELNTPLATLMSHVAEALESAAPTDWHAALQTAGEQAQRMATVVRRLAALQEPQSVERIPGFRMLDLSDTSDG